MGLIQTKYRHCHSESAVIRQHVKILEDSKFVVKNMLGALRVPHSVSGKVTTLNFNIVTFPKTERDEG